MAHEIIVDIDRGLVEVRYRGPVAVAERERALQHVSRLAGQTGLRGVLINFSNAQAAAEGFESGNRFAALLARDPVLRDCRVAYLAIDALQVNPVVETLASARRFPLRRFASRIAAIEWLQDVADTG
ncbi:hypothetical protein [Lysobacter sp. F6437]|uniref:hypothetical protein n=1 Tax=Lysobacter sp. F6437 TaxID=3459296 RepID=UPI00403DE5E6